MANINHTESNVEDLLFRIFIQLQKLNENSIANGFFLPVSSADTAAPINSIYYSTTASKLVYKDSGGVVNNLY